MTQQIVLALVFTALGWFVGGFLSRSAVQHRLIRKAADWLAGKARVKFSGRRLDATLFQIAGLYGCAEMFGLLQAAKMMYHLFVEPRFIRRR